MRVLLIAPPQWAAYGTPRVPVYPALGLLQIAACLEAEGHEVHCIDADADGIGIRDVQRYAWRWHPDLIGVTATTPSFPDARRWAARLKAAMDTPVVVGGPHAAALPREVLQTACFDAVFQGEAEGVITELASRLAHRDTDSAVPGVWWRDGHEPPATPAPVQLDEIPLPSWPLVGRPDRYLPPDARALPVGTVMFSRGCPAGCRFCQSTRMFGARVRYVSPERAVEHAWHVRRSIGAREIHIMDDCFTADRGRSLAIMEELCRRGPKVKWAFGNGLRADMLDDDVLSCMRALGVSSLGIGIETADDAIAESAGKHRDLGQAATVIDAARRMGMSVWGFFMLGLPGETSQTLARTARLSRDLGLDVAKFEIFKPYPGTDLYDELTRKGALTSTEWSDWGIHTPPVHQIAGLSRRDIWRARRKAVLSFHLRAAALRSLARRPTVVQTILRARSAIFLLRTVARLV